jgi:hypothetical protein
MRILEPAIVLSLLTIGTCLAMRDRSRLGHGVRARIVSVGLGLCIGNDLLAFLLYGCIASIYGLHRTSSDFNERDLAVLRFVTRLSSEGAIVSFLTAVCGIAGKPSVARRWLLGIGIFMTLSWLGNGFGSGEVVTVETIRLLAK